MSREQADGRAVAGTGVGDCPAQVLADLLGDALDDRIAEIVDELLSERDAASRSRRLQRTLCTVGAMLAALVTGVLLSH